MPVFALISAVTALVALSAYVNHKFVGLPDSIGITIVALLLSMGIVSVGQFIPEVALWGGQIEHGVHFSYLVFHGLLGLLLFAGSLNVDVKALWRARWLVLLLATVGVLISTAVVGCAFFYLTRSLGLPISIRDSLLFGALISPTDPIAALGLLTQARVPSSLLTKITGEALFNDGTGVVVFITLLGISGTHGLHPEHIVALFAQQVFGGVVFGALVGFGAVALLRTVDSLAVEIPITLSLPLEAYYVALHLGVSAPIAAIIMGLVVGNDGRRFAIPIAMRERLLQFWVLTDELLNLFVFGLVGLELMTLAGKIREFLLPAVLTLPLVLAARAVSVGLPTAALRCFDQFEPHFVKLMTWAGLRGALSVALALSLPPGRSRSLIVTVTYVIAIFSILIQSTTVGRVARLAAIERPEQLPTEGLIDEVVGEEHRPQ